MAIGCTGGAGFTALTAVLRAVVAAVLPDFVQGTVEATTLVAAVVVVLAVMVVTTFWLPYLCHILGTVSIY